MDRLITELQRVRPAVSGQRRGEINDELGWYRQPAAIARAARARAGVARVARRDRMASGSTAQASRPRRVPSSSNNNLPIRTSRPRNPRRVPSSSSNNNLPIRTSRPRNPPPSPKTRIPSNTQIFNESFIGKPYGELNNEEKRRVVAHGHQYFNALALYEHLKQNPIGNLATNPITRERFNKGTLNKIIKLGAPAAGNNPPAFEAKNIDPNRQPRNYIAEGNANLAVRGENGYLTLVRELLPYPEGTLPSHSNMFARGRLERAMKTSTMRQLNLFIGDYLMSDPNSAMIASALKEKKMHIDRIEKLKVNGKHKEARLAAKLYLDAHGGMRLARKRTRGATYSGTGTKYNSSSRKYKSSRIYKSKSQARPTTWKPGNRGRPPAWAIEKGLHISKTDKRRRK